MIIYSTLHLLSRPFQWFFGARIVNADRIPASGPAVLAGNHFHAFDPLLVDSCTKRPIFSLTKQSLLDGPFGWVFRGVGSIPVDYSRSHNKPATAAAVERLRQGDLVGLAPEGHRNKTDQLLLPFKFGAVSMAQKAGCPIVPYAIAGRYAFRDRSLTIQFGQPWSIGPTDDLTEANQRLRQQVEDLLLGLRQPVA
ncbi:MAG: 1-acyl-sn-glycerol-3-phosphate acyltransferase [Propionibacteriaceae bacterium]|jgi:1-acyl-sn-glycerol-3-phosphate acyltransferase|nr:1-acyl-sn-glycerol-3-phosphate acyltransferase [Propionibacteriaceae bacterium]